MRASMLAKKRDLVSRYDVTAKLSVCHVLALKVWNSNHESRITLQNFATLFRLAMSRAAKKALARTQATGKRYTYLRENSDFK